jgi:hypothetical protein
MSPPDEPLLPAIPTRPNSVDSALVTPRFVVAGCVSAVAVGSLLSFLPVKGIVSAIGVLPAAVFYIVQSVFAGALGALLFGAPTEDRSWRRLFATALVLGPAWVWVAPAVLLNYHDSDWALLMAAISAATLAICIRPFVRADHSTEDAHALSEPKEPFTGPIQPVPWDWHGLAIAGCGAAAFAALELDASELACGFAIACAFLFAWQWTSALEQILPSWVARRREWRLLRRTTIPAVIITMLVLAIVSRHSVGGAADSTVNAARETNPGNGTQRRNGNAPGAGFDGYQSIILWPEPPKKEIVAPIPLASLLPPTRMKRPLIIRFTGAYWYFQPPETSVGRLAHLAHGSPLEANIHSTDYFPVTMEAHQNLSAPIRISRLRQIDVLVENRDNRPGRIGIGLALADSSVPRKSEIYLGQAPILSTEPGGFGLKSVPVEETLHFTVPSRMALGKFDELTLIVFPDSSRMQFGAKIAIEEFDFQPR